MDDPLAGTGAGDGARDRVKMWGRHEQQGWVANPDLGLLDLGQEAEERWKLDIAPGESGLIEYVYLYPASALRGHHGGGGEG